MPLQVGDMSEITELQFRGLAKKAAAGILGFIAVGSFGATYLTPGALGAPDQMSAVICVLTVTLVFSIWISVLVRDDNHLGGSNELLAKLTERAQMASVGMMSDGVLNEITREIAHIRLRAAIVIVQAQHARLTPDGIDDHRQKLDLHFDLLDNVLDNVRRHLESEEVLLQKSLRLSEAVRFATAAKARALQEFHIKIEQYGPDPEIRIVAEDAFLLLLNLVQNAIEELRDARTKNPLIRITSEALKEGQQIQVSVGNNGQGLEEDGLMIFALPKPAQRATRQYRLAICKWILEDYGSKMSLINLPDQGARVQFTVPAA